MLEIAKAVRTLTAPNRDDPLRQRRAEIAAIRQDLETLAREIPKAFKETSALVKAELRAALAKKYNPDQPRVPAGNRDGGQWTDRSEVGGEASSNRSDNGASDAPNLPIRYAQASTDTATDATSGGGNAAVTNLEDTQHDLSNLYHALVTAGHTVLGLAAQHFLNSHDFDIKRIDANALPADHPRAPVPFVDSNNEQIYDADGKPLLRPLGLPPELYAQAGNAVRSWVDDFNRDISNVTENPETLMAMAVKILAPLAPGGPLDAERFDWTYVRDYRHYQNIMIGVYGAAAGMNKEDAVYTHSAKQDVEDTKSGYELYRAGRIRLGR